MTNSSSRQQTAWGFHPSRRLDVSQSSSWQFKKLEDSQSNEDFWKKMMARCEQSKKTDNKLTSKIGVYMSYMQKNMYVNKYKMNSVISHLKKKLLDSQQPFLHFFFHTASIANSFPYNWWHRNWWYPPVNKHSNGKSPSWIGNTSSHGGFSIAMLDYRSVYRPEKSEVFSVTAHHWYSLMDAEDWNVISRNAIIAIILTRNASHESWTPWNQCTRL